MYLFKNKSNIQNIFLLLQRQACFGSTSSNSYNNGCNTCVRIKNILSSPVIYVLEFDRPRRVYNPGGRGRRSSSVCYSSAKSSKVPSVRRPSKSCFTSRERISLNQWTVHVLPGFLRRRVNYVVVTKQCLLNYFRGTWV